MNIIELLPLNDMNSGLHDPLTYAEWNNTNAGKEYKFPIEYTEVALLK